ncbi:glycosyltransferase family 4 protein [Pantoea sp. Acro-805]|uniref:Glycosyltransferase family 4 protein n=1 Tax=Candidatus Pantoea formicae TaxID=2608355 RepID=A0ABX0QVK6_9GAMM|nr:glycosyltransferase family 4 protein [Pantoea formicae]MDF7650682.1 glycosyltransferase family 4 protein [Erwiniaceae bacterium L1_54_3]NIE99782.1 glycosyltransferase family 4 protein [Pantoea formicae]
MKIIISGSGYPEKRNIMTQSHHNYVDCRKKNIYFYLNAIRSKLLHKNKQFIFHPLPGTLPNDADVIHLFNEVAHTNRNWIATFETEIPRVLPVPGVAKTANPELHSQLQLIARSECLYLIAISQATLNIQLKLLEAFPAIKKAVAHKLITLHPPQALLCTKPRLMTPGKIHFTFIGSEFYRKGGAEVVLAISQLTEEDVFTRSQIQVTLIGDLTLRHNIAHRQFQDDEAFYARIEHLIKTSPHIQHFTALPNPQVLALLQVSHVGLLPSWQDTYGFSVLEMQASGCPVITTNVRALPEINPEGSGWLIHQPLNDEFEYVVDSDEKKKHIRQQIVQQLKTHIVDILRNPGLITQYSAQSLKRIAEQHDPEKFSEQLARYYSSSKQTQYTAAFK